MRLSSPPLPRLLLLLCAILFTIFAECDASDSVTIPLYMEHNPPKLRVTLTIGRPSRQINAILDFSGSHIWLHRSALQDTQTHDSVNDFDYLTLGESSIYVPIRRAVTAEVLGTMQQLGVTCILGLGLRSPLWRHWQCADFTAAYITFSRGSACKQCPPKEHHSSASSLHFDCDTRAVWNATTAAIAAMAPGGTYPMCSVRGATIFTKESPHTHVKNDAEWAAAYGGSNTYRKMTAFFGGIDMYNTVPSSLYRRIRFFTAVPSAKGIHSSNYIHEMPTLCFGVGVGNQVQTNSICLAPQTYVNNDYARRTLRLHEVIENDNTSSTFGLSAYSALQVYDFHFDASKLHMCAVYAPVCIETPLLYVALTVFWVIVLLVWYSLDTHHIGVVSECYSRITNARIMFIELSVFVTVLLFLIHFVTTSDVWYLALPDRNWLLPIYVVLTFTFNGAQFFDFIVTFAQGGQAQCWVARCILVEMQLLLALWLAQVHTVHGTWFSFGSVLVFFILFFHWTQRFCVLFMAQRVPLRSRLPPRSKQQHRAATRTMFLLYSLWPLHFYIFLRHLLVPMMKILGVVGDTPAYLTSSLVILFLIYVAARKARKDLQTFAKQFRSSAQHI